MPEAAIMPPQGVIPVEDAQTAIAREMSRGGPKRIPRPAAKGPKPAIAESHDPALSPDDEVLVALGEAVMRQAESEPTPESDHAQDWDAADPAHKETHALNVIT